ncbi:MAG: hypothetical protein H7070_04890 [Saprospiraceae bacterium]|nr:hypothetical protein [Pyrinomonadaceae bacterium]
MVKKFSISAALLFLILPQIMSGKVIQSASAGPLTLNERSALSAVRTLHGAEATFQATTGNGNFGSLAAMLKAQLIDAELASGNKYGYVFVVTTAQFVPGSSPAAMTVTATPRVYRKHGRISFFIATDGVIRGADKFGQPATETDPAIDEPGCYLGTNEACTMQAMRTLHGAEATYQATVGNGNFGSLSQLREMNFISVSLATGLAHGYSFTVTTIDQSPGNFPASFRITAVPRKYGVTGIRSFFIATDGVMFCADKNGAPADETDPVCAQ